MRTHLSTQTHWQLSAATAVGRKAAVLCQGGITDRVPQLLVGTPSPITQCAYRVEVAVARGIHQRGPARLQVREDRGVSAVSVSLVRSTSRSNKAFMLQKEVFRGRA